MAGTITRGGQWEHCNCCGASVLIQHLYYGVPNKKAQEKHATPETPWITSGQKLDLCRNCK